MRSARILTFQQDVLFLYISLKLARLRFWAIVIKCVRFYKPCISHKHHPIKIKLTNSNSYLLLLSNLSEDSGCFLSKEFSCQYYDLKWHLPCSLWETRSLDFQSKYKSQKFICILPRQWEDATEWEKIFVKDRQNIQRTPKT